VGRGGIRQILAVALLLAGVLIDGSSVTAASPNIERLAGADRYETATAVSRRFFGPGIDVVLVATGLHFPDALAAGAIGARLGAPVLFVRPDLVPGTTEAELARLQPRRIVVVGGDAVVSEAVRERLASFAADGASRIAGPDRYATAVALSAAHATPGDVAYVASGLNFPDGLAASAAAGAEQGVLLLVRPDEIPAVTAAELARLRPARIVVVGGEGVVSAVVMAALRQYTDGDVIRLAGADRYGTSAAVADAIFGPGAPVFLATGREFPDALAAAAVAGRQRGPILLTVADRLPPGIREALPRLEPPIAFILGGPAVVGQPVIEELEALLGFAFSAYERGRESTQVTTYYCVPASIQTQLNHLYDRNSHSGSEQAGYYATGQQHGKGSYGARGGVDPRGWAWVLHLEASGYGYNDYRWSDQGVANHALMRSLLDTGEPAGVLAARGWHAITAVGFRATDDPRRGGRLLGFHVLDPWYGTGMNSGVPGIGYGLTPNAYVVLGYWNSTYFLPNAEAYTPGVAFWDPYYVAVLRKSVPTPPGDEPEPPYSVVWSQDEADAEAAAQPASASVAAAIVDGIASHGLLADGGLGATLVGVEQGTAVNVEPAGGDARPYTLVELTRDGEVVAVALVTHDSDGYRLGAVRWAEPGYRLPTSQDASDILAAQGVEAADPEPVWAWSEESRSPFVPLWRADVPGGVKYLAPDGQVLEALTLADDFEKTDPTL